ncbi:MAG: DUF459 domain-containing protein, partial [Deltaproteobacteria bacterium]|nr:DUF459 domain-containing protein [Deltaproteobacteria bacterium]
MPWRDAFKILRVWGRELRIEIQSWGTLWPGHGGEPRPPRPVRPEYSSPWRVWNALGGIFLVLLVYESGRFNQWLLEAELSTRAPERTESRESAPPEGLRWRETAHRAVIGVLAAWTRLEEVRETVGLAALAELEQSLSRGLGDALLIRLDARDPGARPEQDSPGGEGGTQGSRMTSRFRRDPRVYLLVGDSMMLSPLGSSLGQGLTSGMGGRFVRKGVVATGLARPDYFDWRAQLKKLVGVHSPSVLVVLFGINDVNAARSQGGRLVAFGSEAFFRIYAEHVRAFLAAAQELGLTVLWVETPFTEDPVMNTKLERINQTQKDGVSEYANAHWLPTWTLFQDSKGEPLRYLKTGDGRSHRLWETDGVHLAVEASRQVAAALAPRMVAEVRGQRALPPGALGSTSGAASPERGAAVLPEEPLALDYYSAVLGGENRVWALQGRGGAGGEKTKGAKVLLVYREQDAAWERHMRSTLAPLVTRLGMTVLMQPEPWRRDPQGRPTLWEAEGLPVERYLGELLRLTRRRGLLESLDGLAVVSAGQEASPGADLLLHSGIPCLSLMRLPPPRRKTRSGQPLEPADSRAGVQAEAGSLEDPAILETLLPWKSRRVLLPKIPVAGMEPGAGSPWASKRLVEAGFDLTGYDAPKTDTALREELPRLLVWHQVCRGVNDPAWTGAGRDGGELLQQAIAVRAPDLAAQVIARKADISLRDREGNTPLLNAVRVGLGPLVRLLLSAGADVAARNDEGWSALALAALKGDASLPGVLLEAGAPVDSRDDQERTPLMAAAWRGRTDTLEMLLDHGADLEATDKTGETALMKAAKYDKSAAAVLLIERGARLERGDRTGKNALFKAAQNHNAALAKLLLAKGASVDSRDRHRWTPLMEAARVGSLAVVKVLIERGADPEALGDESRT